MMVPHSALSSIGSFSILALCYLACGEASDAPTETADAAAAVGDASTLSEQDGTAGSADAGGDANIAPSVPCELNITAKACWAAHTGVPGWSGADILAGKSPLVHTVGDRNITEDGAVIENQWIDGCLSINANNVTIKNSFVHTLSGDCAGGNKQAGRTAINSGNCTDDHPAGTIAGLTIVDSEIDVGNSAKGYAYGAVGACAYSLLRVNAHGGSQTLWTGRNVSVIDSFIHDPTNAASPDHTEAIDADSGDHVALIHNWISAANTPQTDFQTGGVSINNSWGAPSYFVVQNNFIEGANGADVNFGGGKTVERPWGNAHHITFTGNRLSPNTAYGNQFFYGWEASHEGMVWNDNANSETLAALNP